MSLRLKAIVVAELNLVTDEDGKAAQGLGLVLRFNDSCDYEAGGLEVREGAPPSGGLVGPRVGINYAYPVDGEARWRLASSDRSWVGHRKSLSSETTFLVAG